MRVDEELSGRVLEAERRVLRAAGAQAAETERRDAAPGAGVLAGEEKEEAVMGDGVSEDTRSHQGFIHVCSHVCPPSEK
eukprot:3113255-Amphidinium_carterae.1